MSADSTSSPSITSYLFVEAVLSDDVGSMVLLTVGAVELVLAAAASKLVDLICSD